MTKLKIFIVAQIVLGSLVGFIALLYAVNNPFVFLIVFFYYGLFASHVSLLGFWTGMGLTVWWKRLLGFFCGSIRFMDGW